MDSYLKVLIMLKTVVEIPHLGYNNYDNILIKL